MSGCFSKKSCVGEEKKQEKDPLKPNIPLRVLLVLTFIGTTVVGGYYPYAFFKQLEKDKALQEYDAVVKQAEVSFQEGMTNKIETLRTVNTIMRSTCPLASTWPNCSVTPEIFDTLSESMKVVGKMSSVGTAPLLSTSNQKEIYEFEQYASQVYLDAGISSFGLWSYPNSSVRGIVSADPELGIFHDLEGSPDSPNDYLAPVMHFTGTTFSPGAAASVLFNINYEPLRLDAIGDAVDCFNEASSANNSTEDCYRITDFVVPQVQDFKIAPAAMTVYPQSIEGELKGLSFATHYWSSLIENSIASYVNGVVAVISTNTRVFTYVVNNGDAGDPVEGDMHDPEEDHTRHSFIANIRGKGDVEYTVEFYASKTYYSSFEDNRAIYACIIGVSISVVSAFLFFLYDFFLSRSAREQAVILATKRAFVRYISHEIRTPLNTVNIGLKVLMQELVRIPAFVASISSAEGDSGVDEVQLEEKQKELLDLVMEIEESSDTAVNILNDLINYDKISMNNMMLELEVLDGFALLEGTYHPFLLQARQKNIEMSIDINRIATEENDERQIGNGGDNPKPSCHSIRVVGDAVKLTQVFRNLLSNALKFTPSGGRIEVTAKWDPSIEHLMVPEEFSEDTHQSGALVISVKDSGAGISLANQQELFKEGRQFNANRLQGGSGSGLGLFITRGVVKLHGGEIIVHSKGEGCGCTFTIILPAVLIEPDIELCKTFSYFDDSPAEKNSCNGPYKIVKHQEICEHNARGSVPRSGDLELTKGGRDSESDGVKHPVAEVERIMVVDDSLPSRKMLCRLLKNAGYHCTQAENGQECVDMMVRDRDDESHSTDNKKIAQLIFMDFEMPIMTGPEAAKALRNLGFKLPIVGVTGNVLPADKTYFMKMGANEVLSKPLHIDDVNALVRKYSNGMNSDELNSCGEAQSQEVFSISKSETDELSAV